MKRDDNLTISVASIAVIFLAFVSAGCLSGNGAGTGKTTDLTGAGSTFIYPLMSKWAGEYSKINPAVRVNYQSIGSGGGIQQMIAGSIDFGASDAPMSDEEYGKAQGILHIPVTIGAVVVSYNLPELKGVKIKLSGDVISDIFLGKIKKWNDAKIKELNPEISLPDKEIAVVHRSDGSGTTYVFTDYLSSVSGEWLNNVGRGKSVSWPAGIGAKGNEGVTAVVAQTPYSIGYIELAYAKINKIDYALVKNREGSFADATQETIKSAAGNSAQALPKSYESWSSVTIVNAPGADSYPVSSFVYLLAYRNQKDPEKGKALKEFLGWMVESGQSYSAELEYAAMPSEIVKLNKEEINLIKLE